MRTPEQLVRDTKPFPAEWIDQAGSGRTFVSWSEYNQVMLYVHPEADYDVTSVTYAPGYHYPVTDDDGATTEEMRWSPPVWAVAVQFVIEGTRYAGVGSSDDPLSAESNAYKRACSHAGIGLHLYQKLPKTPYWLHDRLVIDADGLAIDASVKGDGDGD